MQNIAGFIQDLFDVNEQTFTSKTLAIFHYQAENNPVYRKFLHYLDKNPSLVTRIEDIPFLPISLYKQQQILIEGCKTDFYCGPSEGNPYNCKTGDNPTQYITETGQKPTEDQPDNVSK